MRRAFFFIVVFLFATTSLASIPRVSALDATPPAADTLSETRIRVSEVLAPFERPQTSELTRALRRGYGDASRAYASGLGRFLSPDPVLGNLLEPQSWNRYAYVLNNPINFIDPFGLAARKHGEKMEPDDTCPGQVVDGWCTDGETITVSAPDPSADAAMWLTFRWLNRRGPYSEAMRDWQVGWVGGWSTVWQRFGEFNTPETKLEAAMMMFPWGKAGRVLTPSWKHAIRALGKKGLDARKAKAAIHKLKRSEGRRGLDNVLFDTETGDVVSRETGDIIGNLFDDFF